MRHSLLLLALICSTACGTSLNFIPTTRPPHRLHARGPGSVELYMSGRPNRPFVEVGLVESQQEGWSVDETDEVIQKMRDYAGELGCDALVIFSGNDATIVSGSNSLTSSRTLKGYRGSCVVYTKSPPQVAPSPSPLHANPNTCTPNSTQLCYGPAGCRGGQRCTENGNAYTQCDCGPQPEPQVAAP